MTVIVIGSSGGGTATLGHTDPTDLLRTINFELSKIQPKNKNSKSNLQVSYGLFLSLHGGKGLDNVNPLTTMATLYKQTSSSKSSDQNISPIFTGTLNQVNEMYRKLDSGIITNLIQSGTISGMICISCDPNDVNSSSLKAAADMGIAVTGSGGTSLSAAVVKYNINLVGNAGGSVATTTHTRAVSYCHALASAWGCQYSPFYSAKDPDGNKIEITRPHIRSVLDSCVPAFIAVCVTSKIAERLSITENRNCNESNIMVEDGCLHGRFLHILRQEALPIVCCVVCASAYAPEHKSTVLMAACVAASVCSGSILGGLLAGWMVAWLVGRALYFCIRFGVPATMTNIIVAGGSGSLVASFLYYTYSIQALIFVTEFIRSIVQSCQFEYILDIFGDIFHAPSILSFPWDGRTGFGFVFGCVFCYGSKIGWYHSIFLPVILIEMEQGEASLWGSIDECTLVLVSAGICLGNICFDMIAKTSTCLLSKGDVAISKRGLCINLLCGDFIEAAYPFMERSMMVNFFSYVACGIATEILYKENPKNVLSSAYMPVLISIWLAEDWQRISLACIAAFGISFVGSLLGNFFTGGSEKEEKGNKEN